MMMPTDVEDRVRRFVLTSFLTDTPPDAFGNGDDLFQLLDSLQVLRLVLHLESAFGIKVQPEELSADNLSTVRKVADFVARKRGGHPPPRPGPVPDAAR
jgi:acyl carrier protein